MTEQNGAERSSATERLRAMLDERGVEYEAPHAGFTIVRTDNAVCKFYETLEEPERGVFAVVTTDWLTPEQAIAATLGFGECSNLADEAGWFECSSCGAEASVEWRGSGYGVPRFCPNCGRKVVGE